MSDINPPPESGTPDEEAAHAANDAGQTVTPPHGTEPGAQPPPYRQADTPPYGQGDPQPYGYGDPQQPYGQPYGQGDTQETPSAADPSAGDTQSFPAQPLYPPPSYPAHGYPQQPYGGLPPYGQPSWTGGEWQSGPWAQPGAGGAGGWGGPPPAQHWGPPPQHPQPQHAKHKRFPLVIVGLSAALAAGLVGVGIGHAAWHQSAASSPNTGNGGGNNNGGFSFPGNGNGNGGFQFPGSTNGGSGSGSSGSGSSSASPAANATAAKVDPALVDINTSLSYQGAEAAGTGIVLNSSGLVLTNNHVINGATTISATDIGNGKTYTASVVGFDRSHDVALIQLRNASGLKSATIGDSSGLKVGQSIIGIGNAGGSGGTPSVVTGSVTALNRDITASDQGGGDSEQLTGLVQVNANIQPGDSGGPMVNSSGQVLGIDTAASDRFSFQSSTTEGFAIPINNAMSIAQKIEAHQATSTIHLGDSAFIGVEVEGPGAQQQGGGFSFGGGDNGSTTSGATVVGVVSGSPADQAGLQDGDTIVSVNGKSINSPTALTNALLGFHPGDTVQLTWTDTSGQQQTASVQLATGPAE